MDLSESDIKRFWTKVEKGDGCWLWTAARSTVGYGVFRLGDMVHRSHRVSYFLENRHLTDGLQVMHLCDVRHCVNPEHLVEGTNQLNSVDAAAKGRLGGKGSSGPSRDVFTEADIAWIRSTAASGRMNQRQIADSLGVTPECISQIVRYVTWKHVA